MTNPTASQAMCRSCNWSTSIARTSPAVQVIDGQDAQQSSPAALSVASGCTRHDPRMADRRDGAGDMQALCIEVFTTLICKVTASTLINRA